MGVQGSREFHVGRDRICAMKYAILYLVDRPGTTELLGHVFDKIISEGLFESIFYDGTVNTKSQFIADVLRTGSMPFVVMADDDVAGFAWLNSFEGRTARVHFVCFRRFWGHTLSIPIGRRYLRYVLTRRDEHGYLFDSLVGITPKDNALACRMALKCGCVMAGTIPNFLYVAERGLSVDAVAVAATRESVGVHDGEVTEAVWDA